jgi:septal ring factor EnvC (AmiA/AmiB activator)
MFLFDARRMLLSLMCADECSVTWPYLLVKGDTDGIVAPDNLESIRAEFAAVVEERRERCRPVLVADFHALQRESNNQIAALNVIVSGQASQKTEQTVQIDELTTQVAEQTSQIAELTNQVAEQTSLNAEQTSQIGEQSSQIEEQSSQIADLQRPTQMLVEQNQQMQEQLRQLLMPREQEPSADVDEDGSRAVKRRRLNR